MRHFYLESGSGAKSRVSVQAVEKVKHVIDEFIWVGGGIRQKDEVKLMVEAKVDMIVIGTVLEENPKQLSDLLQGLD